MFGPSIKTVFKSKWHALIWSAFMLVTAYYMVPSKDDIGQADAIAASAASSKGGHDPGSHHANPWAKDPG